MKSGRFRPVGATGGRPRLGESDRPDSTVSGEIAAFHAGVQNPARIEGFVALLMGLIKGNGLLASPA
jgi:hypothetical protein